MTAARIIGAMILAIIVALGLWLGPRSCSNARQSAAVATANQARAEGQVKAATDATGITATAMEGAAASDRLSRETADVIRSTPGADTPVDPALNDQLQRRLKMLIGVGASERGAPEQDAALPVD